MDQLRIAYSGPDTLRKPTQLPYERRDDILYMGQPPIVATPKSTTTKMISSTQEIFGKNISQKSQVQTYNMPLQRSLPRWRMFFAKPKSLLSDFVGNCMVKSSAEFFLINFTDFFIFLFFKI